MKIVKWLYLSTFAVAMAGCAVESTEGGGEEGKGEARPVAVEPTETAAEALNRCGWTCNSTGVTGYIQQRFCENQCPGHQCTMSTICY